MIGVYTVMGDYDVVAAGEAPNDEAAMSFALALGAKGNVRSATLKAFPKEVCAEIVNKLP